MCDPPMAIQTLRLGEDAEWIAIRQRSLVNLPHGQFVSLDEIASVRRHDRDHIAT